MYNVTGTLTPDATCNYIATGHELNGKFIFRRIDSAYHIWWGYAGVWNITVDIAKLGTAYWQRIDPNIIGVYTPMGTALGNATVGLGEHP